MMAKSSAPMVAETAAKSSAEAAAKSSAKTGAETGAETAAEADTKTGRISLIWARLLYSRVRPGGILTLIPRRHFSRLELVHA
ncbi:hypothetical protein [Paenibacillus sp. CECT 9249]|uniref:hypothetical protein n=1 Tax=Paenibacillus sp. CECT 9249 TaxID=2845385 RepID=UPI001E2E108A|nr:hypothetical protein [Paenibacillus sp. CECT 9249]